MKEKKGYGPIITPGDVIIITEPHGILVKYVLVPLQLILIGFSVRVCARGTPMWYVDSQSPTVHHYVIPFG